MSLEESLMRHIQEFHFDLGGITLWAPYLRNDNYTQDPSVPRGLGKSSPEEILAAATYIHQQFPNIYGEAIRAKLIDGSLSVPEFNYKGIDCSGFIFYVMDRTFNDLFGRSVAEDLSVPKDHVLNGANNLDEWKKAYTLSEEEANKLPQDVPMTWVVDTFKRKPVNLCRVLGLVSDYSSVPVDLKDIRVSDIIWMRQDGDATPHAGIVTGKSKNQITITHSGRRDPDDIGGVISETIPMVNDSPVTSQMSVARNFLGARRLKSLTTF